MSREGRVSTPFYFEQHRDHPSSQTWQVERAQLDVMLVERARELGVEVREGVKVKKFIEENGAIVGVEGEDFEIRAPITIDASGRDALYQTKARSRRRDPKLNKIAIWTLYRGGETRSGD